MPMQETRDLEKNCDQSRARSLFRGVSCLAGQSRVTIVSAFDPLTRWLEERAEFKRADVEGCRVREDSAGC
jgi:hypothetical protein